MCEKKVNQPCETDNKKLPANKFYDRMINSVVDLPPWWRNDNGTLRKQYSYPSGNDSVAVAGRKQVDSELCVCENRSTGQHWRRYVNGRVAEVLGCHCTTCGKPYMSIDKKLSCQCLELGLYMIVKNNQDFTRT